MKSAKVVWAVESAAQEEAMRSTMVQIAAAAFVIAGLGVGIATSTSTSEAEANPWQWPCNPNQYPRCSHVEGDSCSPGASGGVICWLSPAACEPGYCTCEPNGEYVCF